VQTDCSKVVCLPPEMRDRRRWQDAYGESLADMMTTTGDGDTLNVVRQILWCHAMYGKWQVSTASLNSMRSGDRNQLKVIVYRSDRVILVIVGVCTFCILGNVHNDYNDL